MQNTISRGALIHPCWDMEQEMLDKIFVTNRGSHSRENDRGVGIFIIGSFAYYRVGNDSVEQEVAPLRIDNWSIKK